MKTEKEILVEKIYILLTTTPLHEIREKLERLLEIAKPETSEETKQ